MRMVPYNLRKLVQGGISRNQSTLKFIIRTQVGRLRSVKFKNVETLLSPRCVRIEAFCPAFKAYTVPC